MRKLTKNFTYEELKCPTTGEAKFEGDTLDRLQMLRDTLGKPMVITSGARTTVHNEWLQSRGYPASPNSFHLINNPKYSTDCCAFDVSITSGVDRSKLVKLALDQGWSVGAAKTFIHIDLRLFFANLPQTMYVY